jgi:hypothetical protein
MLLLIVDCVEVPVSDSVAVSVAIVAIVKFSSSTALLTIGVKHKRQHRDNGIKIFLIFIINSSLNK